MCIEVTWFGRFAIYFIVTASLVHYFIRYITSSHQSNSFHIVCQSVVCVDSTTFLSLFKHEQSSFILICDLSKLTRHEHYYLVSNESLIHFGNEVDVYCQLTEHLTSVLSFKYFENGLSYLFECLDSCINAFYQKKKLRKHWTDDFRHVCLIILKTIIILRNMWKFTFNYPFE